MTSVIWDFDGTIANFRFTWVNAVGLFLSDFPSSVNESCSNLDDFFVNSVRRALPWSPEHVRDFLSPHVWWYRFCLRLQRELGIPNEASEILLDHFPAIVWDIDKPLVRENMLLLLEISKRNGYDNIVVTNNYPGFSQKVDESVPQGLIDRTVVSGDVGWCKPSPLLFRYLTCRLGISSPVLVIGDSETDFSFSQVCNAQYLDVRNLQKTNSDLFISEAVKKRTIF